MWGRVSGLGQFRVLEVTCVSALKRSVSSGFGGPKPLTPKPETLNRFRALSLGLRIACLIKVEEGAWGLSSRV